MAKLRVRARRDGILTESHIHDGAIVISGSMTARYGDADVHALIAEGLEEAAREVVKRGGITGHIKAAVAATSTTMISVTEEKAMARESPGKEARVTLSAILFLIDQTDAENIIRNVLTTVNTLLQGDAR